MVRNRVCKGCAELARMERVRVRRDGGAEERPAARGKAPDSNDDVRK